MCALGGESLAGSRVRRAAELRLQQVMVLVIDCPRERWPAALALAGRYAWAMDEPDARPRSGNDSGRGIRPLIA